MTRRGKKDDLPNEDAVLWEHVTRSVSRMGARRAKNRTVKTAGDMPAAATPPTAVQPPLSSTGPVAADKPQLPPAPKVRKIPPPPIGLEPGKTRRIARGRDEIEARLDLHGMRQSEAHGALRGFLVRAYANGCRTVLVITGKGRATGIAPDAPFDLFQERDRGILRRLVPQWLADPELRAIVVGYTSAHTRHGGDGAFYVQLRNRDRHRG